MYKHEFKWQSITDGPEIGWGLRLYLEFTHEQDTQFRDVLLFPLIPRKQLEAMSPHDLESRTLSYNADVHDLLRDCCDDAATIDKFARYGFNPVGATWQGLRAAWSAVLDEERKSSSGALLSDNHPVRRRRGFGGGLS